MKLLLLVLLMASSLATEWPPSTPPVVIWGAQLKEQRDIFQIIKMKKLASRLRPLLKDHMIIVYLEPELTAKNLSCSASNCFAFLRHTKPRTYYSKVRDPLAAMEKLLLERNRPLIWSNRRDLLALPCQVNSIHVYNFYDHDLNEHDRFMQAVASHLASCEVVQIYTAMRESPESVYVRLRQDYEISKKMGSHETSGLQEKRDDVEGSIDAENATESLPEVVMRHPRGILVLRKIVYAKEIRVGRIVQYARQYLWMAHQNPQLSVDIKGNSQIRRGVTFTVTTLQDNLTITLAPIVGNWRMTKITFANTTFTLRDLVFYSTEFSFCCSSLTAFSDQGSRITLYSFNLDVVIEENISAMDPDYKPQACWLCQEYMTPGLIQGFFTVTILLALLAVGFVVFLNMGRNARVAGIDEPEPHVKVPTER